jgi:hypothetical protein
VWRWQGQTVLILTLVTLAGSLAAAAVRAARRPPDPQTVGADTAAS